MRRHRRDYELLSEMNLTNLLDTAFVLLIAFILVAPSVLKGLSVELPQVGGSDLTNVTAKTLSIQIGKPLIPGADDRIMVDDRWITLEELKVIVDGRKRSDPKLSVIVEGDDGSRYGTFAKVVGILKAAGIENLGLPTEPVEPPGKADKGREGSKSR